MLYLHQFPKLKDQQFSMSPFCLKLELYLKIMNIDYQNYFSLELNKSPTGKMPYIEKQGKKFADSNLIINKLEAEADKPIDFHLNNQQKAQAWAFVRMCEDSLYYTGVYSRWIDSDNAAAWKKLLSESANIPKVMMSIIYPAAKRGVVRQLKAQGTTLLSKNEIYQQAEKAITAIADSLDGRRYFFNDQISLVDISVFSLLVMIDIGSCGKRLKAIFDSTNLRPFMDNMKVTFFTPEK